MSKDRDRLRILVFDIELTPIEAYVWSPWDQNIQLNQIKEDWSVLSYAAKWLDEPHIFYQDQRGKRNVRDDKQLLKGIWKLLDEADIVVTQNGKQFDEKKLNARFIINGLVEPTPFKHADTKQMAKRRFGFTYNSLEYLAKALNVGCEKMKSKVFLGQDLWTECLMGNIDAFKEMEKYNKQDVIVTEKVYKKLLPWGVIGFDRNKMSPSPRIVCKQCGKDALVRRGDRPQKKCILRTYQCKECGGYSSEKIKKS